MIINKNALKRVLLGIHKLGLRFGICILPVHYCSPVPSILELRKTLEIWARKSELPGIKVDLDEQAENLRMICLPFQDEYAGNRAYREGVSGHFGSGYGYIEAQALHGVIRHYQPKRVIEVGSGVSTYCLRAALEMNAKKTNGPVQLVSIDPRPSSRLRSLSRIKLIPQPVQAVPLTVFGELGPKDLLFVDSSHAVKPGSDVNYLILEVLPRLRPGVIVHFHDIHLPYDYQRDTLRTFFHWTETSLLRAFLIFNERAKIIFCLSHLHYEKRGVLREVFPEYRPREDSRGLETGRYLPFEPVTEHYPSSIYIELH